MTGLDNLVNKIKTQALDEEKVILLDAENQASKYISAEREKIDFESKKLENKLRDEREMLIERMKSNTELKARNNKLQAKQDVIKRVFDEVLDELKSIDNEEYINYIKTCNISTDSELVVMKDKLDYIRENLPNIKVAENRFVNTGFIEVTKDTENNYTFESRLKLIKEELEGNLADILFADR